MKRDRAKAEWLGNQARMQPLSCLIEMGLTPSSASRCQAYPMPEKKDTGGISGYFDSTGPAS